MGRQSPKVSPGWLQPENLIEFIDELRREHNYNIGVSQYIAAQELILALSAKEEQLEEPQRLRSFLGPLLCSSPTEQDDFKVRFDQWVERMGFTVDEVISEDEKAQKFEQELKKIERKWRWQRWVLLAIIVCLAIVLANFLVQQLPPPTDGDTPIPFLNFNDVAFPQEWQTILLWLMLVPLVTFLAWRLWWYWRASLYLKRRETKRQPEIQRVSISGLNEELFPSVLFLRIAQGLRRRIRVPSNDLDVDKTVEKTLRRGGWFAPVYGYRQVLPEYLVLIDRANYSDHQARFVKEMITQLTYNEVFIEGYYFDSDPRVCFPMTGKESPSKLGEIALKYSQHRLIVFSDADGFFSSLTGEPQPWLDLFSSWPERAVLTPKPSEHWGYQELKLSQEFIVLPATNDGLIDLIRSIEYGKLPYVPSEKNRAPFPEALRVRGRRWIERDAPEPWLVADVLESLRHYLGKAGYYWLSACAVFPELHWNLTVYLGNTLQTDDGSSLLQACRLTDLALLPWFRYGYMPDWLRSWLIYELSSQQEDEIRQLLRSFLVAQPDEQGSVGRWQLEIARQHSDVVSRLAQPLLRLFYKEASADSPLRDYIFQEFMAGSKRLAVRMPEELRKQLSRKYSQQVGWGLWFQWVLANFVGGAVGGYVAVAVTDAIGTNSNAMIWVIIGATFGLVIGLTQWLVLRTKLSQTGWWILATFLSFTAGLFVCISVIEALSLSDTDNVPIALIGGAIGAVIGLAQWLVLRTKLSQTGWWILATTLGSAGIMAAIIFLNDSVFNPLSNTLGDLVGAVVNFAILGAVYGAITGSALVWLLRQPGNSAINNQN